MTGNSFAAPHIAGYATRIRAAHPGITPFETKALLAPIGGATPRQPKVDADDDDTEGHLFGTGPSTQGEALPRTPATTRTATDRDGAPLAGPLAGSLGSALSAVAARSAFTSNGVIPGCAARIRAA